MTELGPGVYVGMPAAEYLEMFGRLVSDAFGEVPYLVGSATKSKSWRDVDVRLLLEREQWDVLGFGEPTSPNLRWKAYVMAFAELGRRVTGLPVDFQIQERETANKLYSNQNGHWRMALGLGRWPRVPAACADCDKLGEG